MEPSTSIRLPREERTRIGRSSNQRRIRWIETDRARPTEGVHALLMCQLTRLQPGPIEEECIEGMREQFEDRQRVELTSVQARENDRARSNRGFNLGANGVLTARS